MSNNREAPEIGLSSSPPAIFDDRDPGGVHVDLLDVALLIGRA
jgi:hypothetical protein